MQDGYRSTWTQTFVSDYSSRLFVRSRHHSLHKEFPVHRMCNETFPLAKAPIYTLKYPPIIQMHIHNHHSPTPI
jgi:hypothetical protein